ncbi:unnamed protein product [Litomosoides sigmodontis]|uniref:Uncharacterized protein n=1 Tax=Litomosoides sigmodontis TaxID=42156 RepID=A0A3P6UAI2_LITSI|nr:unnamed protein product [Litomosoides sigmodontis]
MSDTFVNTLQYVGQHDSDNRKLKKRDKPPGRVQWNLQANIELDEPKHRLDSDETSQQLKVRDDEEDEVRNVIRGINESSSESNLYRGDNEPRTTAGPPLPPKERVNKQFPKVVPVQEVKPIITTVAATTKPTTAATITALTKKSESSDDILPTLFHPIERQQRNIAKKPSAGSVTSYRNSLRKISLSSTTFAP